MKAISMIKSLHLIAGVFLCGAAAAADVSCANDDGSIGFLFSGSGGTGPAIVRLTDERIALECQMFSCVGNHHQLGKVGVELNMRSNPDEITVAAISEERFWHSTEQVQCDVAP